MLRASGIVRLFAIPITVVVGCVAAAAVGMYDFHPVIDARRVGIFIGVMLIALALLPKFVPSCSQSRAPLAAPSG